MKRNIIKPSILPGFMELLPKEQRVFNDIVSKITKVYEDNGCLGIDTPIIEKEEVLLAKSGGETEKQVYSFQKGKNNLVLRLKPIVNQVNNDKQKIYTGGYDTDIIKENGISYSNMSLGSIDTISDVGKKILNGTFLTDTTKHARGDYIKTDLRQWFNQNRSTFQDWIKTLN